MSNVTKGPFPGLPAEELEKRLIETRTYGKQFIHGITFVCQMGSTGSVWAEMVRRGIIKERDICWAVVLHRRPKLWLGVYLDTGNGKAVFCDLRTPEGKKRLNEIERKCKKLVGWK